MSDKLIKTSTLSIGYDSPRSENENTPQPTKMVADHGLVANFDSFLLHDSDPTMVFIYDMMREIVEMPLNEQLGQLYPDLTPLATLVLSDRLLTNTKFTNSYEIIHGDLVNIEDLVEDGTDIMREVYPKYDHLRRIYNGYLDGFKMNGTVMENDFLLLKKGETSEREEKLCHAAAQLLNAYDGQWAKQCLELVKKRSTETGKKHANVILSEHGLVCGAIDLIMSGNTSFVPIENIYSSINGSKTWILERICQRFGKECTFVVVTSNPETTVIAEKLKIRCWPIQSDEDIKMLYTTQLDL